MESNTLHYYVILIMCFTSCLGQILHADVLTDFFTGNSGYNRVSKKMDTNRRNQTIHPPILDGYIDMLLHKNHQVKLKGMKVNPMKEVLRGKSNELMMQRNRDLENINEERKFEKVRTRPEDYKSSFRKQFLFGEHQKHDMNVTNLKQKMVINKENTPTNSKEHNARLSRNEELLRTILKRKGIDIKFLNKDISTSTNLAGPNLQSRFKGLKRQKTIELPLVENVKRLSKKLSTDKFVITTTPTQLLFPPITTTPQFSKHSLQNDTKIVLPLNDQNAITLHQTTTSSSTKRHDTQDFILSKAQKVFTSRQLIKFPKLKTEFTTTRQHSQELSSTTLSLAMQTTQQILNTFSLNPAKRQEQPRAQLQTTSPPSFTAQNEMRKDMFQKTAILQPLTTIYQITEKSKVLPSSTLSTTMFTNITMDRRNVTEYFESITASNIMPSSFTTQSKATIPMQHKEVNVSATQLGSDLEMKSRSKERNLYQTIDDKVKSNNSQNKLLVASETHLLFEELKKPNILIDLKNNGKKEKKTESSSDCMKECTIQNICKNGATCVNSCQGFTCVCAEGFTGFFCDKIVEPT